MNDRDRTRTCNPQIRSLMPYPLGHTAEAEIPFQSKSLELEFALAKDRRQIKPLTALIFLVLAGLTVNRSFAPSGPQRPLVACVALTPFHTTGAGESVDGPNPRWKDASTQPGWSSTTKHAQMFQAQR